MDITGIQNPINTDLLAKSPQAIVDAWKVGQLVNARAVSAQKNGQATVNINGALLLAQTQYPLKPGQPLQLEVSGLAALTVLKVIANTSGISGGSPGNTPPIIVSLPPQPQLVNLLQAGQQLNAVFTQPVDSHQTRTLLELAGNRVSVQLSQALPGNVGQPIKLEVVNPGAMAALKILPTATVTESATLSQALRTTLSRQVPLPSLLSNLALIAKDRAENIAGTAPLATTGTTQRTASLPPLPPPLVELVRSVVDKLPRSDTIRTGDGLKQAVAQSGLFMEAKLAQALQQPTTGVATPPIDFKGGLLNLLLTLLNFSRTPPPTTPASSTHTMSHNAPHAQTGAQATLNPQMNLQQVLSVLLRNVEGGLARLQLSQLVSSVPDDDGKRAWVMELPVRTDTHIDVIQLRIEKDKGRRSAKKTALWTVTLALELSGLGPVQARISLIDKTVSTNFWATHAHTTELIHQHLTMLQQRYQEVGLKVGVLQAHHGTAPEPAAPDQNLPHILLDEKA